ncbi:ankyrin repeat domain-containing protein, putative [Pediculus humanus corporis]|uniref:Ankyrin repeat domain-containing protein, putative n=1 Tax=Pediculus humanus subsp. corporis TaxID=121224 RepID=E0VM12_PEDHC|nr:ankyrin repeat domain-containing protein, putative [Pediculus humanus corporis]EEB14418.1 ankyrin repeat domain-containing protein, putative [Pediculus humanus corporis]
MVYRQISDAPALIHAIIIGELEDVTYLLNAKEDPNVQDFEQRSPLHAASFFEADKIVEVLIQNGARVNSKDSKWITPLHLACFVGHQPTVEVLLKHNADVNVRDRSWHTPIHIASANNSLNCVKSLLPHITNINVTDREGKTCLHHAAYNGHFEMVKFLLENGCHVNVSDKKFRRPLHWAVHMGHSDIVEYLIEKGADVNARDRDFYTPLHVCNNSYELAQILLENGAKIDAKTAAGNTPLHLACLNGCKNIVIELICFNAPINESNYAGQSPLQISAASTLGEDCMKILLTEGADINHQSLDGRTALHMTAIHGRLARSKILIDKGAVIDATDKTGCTTLHIAALYGHELLSRILLSYGADPLKKDNLGRTPLHLCCLGGFVECCRKFVQLNLDLNVQDNSGKTSLHLAAYKGSIECLDLLNTSALCCGKRMFNCVYTLVGIGSSVTVKDVSGCTPLHLAAAYDLEGKCVEYLIKHNKDCANNDNEGFTPIHYAVFGRNQAGLKHLLQNYDKKINDDTCLKITSLHIASYYGFNEIMRLLLPLFNNVNVKDELGRTPLQLASLKGHCQCVQLLLRCGALVAVHDDVNKRTPVHAAAVNGHTECLQMLLDNAETTDVVNFRDNKGRTPLMLAVAHGSSNCIIALLQHGADVNIPDYNNYTPLFRATFFGNFDNVELLICQGASVNVKDCNGKTPVHIAALRGFHNILVILIEHLNENISCLVDQQDCTVLHWASYKGNFKCIEYLVNNFSCDSWKGNSFTPVHSSVLHGKKNCLELLLNYFGEGSVSIKDHKGRTPLHIAALCNSISCLKLLIKRGADVECKDSNGRTPLILSALKGHARAIEILLKAKADATIQDNSSNTALHYACAMRYHLSAMILIQNSENNSIVNIPNKQKKTPLHIAAKQGLVTVTQLLIQKGANILAVDSDGLTPALSCAPSKNVAQCLNIILSHYPSSTEFKKARKCNSIGTIRVRRIH